jgi:putative methyltransferase (TIGR04325 family)
MTTTVPVVLFAYARPAHLARVLACLRENRVPLLRVFADGAKGPADAPAVAETRAMLRAIDWTEVRLVERTENLGLGRNVLAGVTEIAAQHEAFVVWEDDLICVPGTYAWLCAALRQYAGDPRVMSVTAWTHPRVTPGGLAGRPYFDARAECWGWGAWARSWRGMDQTAVEKMAAARAKGVAPDAYGADLPAMARAEARKNIWAVRWLYHHLQHGGLCLRPPWSMVEHIGFDPVATNAGMAHGWANPPLPPAPPVPAVWPAAVENPDCRRRWVVAAGSARWSMAGRWRQAVRKVVPSVLLAPVVARFFRVRWEGDYPDWQSARAACHGYEAPQILQHVLAASRQVRGERATYERDGVAFRGPPPWWPGLALLREAAAARGGKLTVLDFGGSLGSLYFQVRTQLPDCGFLRWRVVEQPAFVAAGRREFQNGELEFYSSVAAACDAGMPDVLLLASVLPYLPAPFEILARLLETGAPWILVDRTGFTRDGGSRLTIQRVPRSIYPASYPCWFLDRAEFLSHFAGRYRLTSDQAEKIVVPAGLEFRSLHFSPPVA